MRSPANSRTRRRLCRRLPLHVLYHDKRNRCSFRVRRTTRGSDSPAGTAPCRPAAVLGRRLSGSRITKQQRRGAGSACPRRNHPVSKQTVLTISPSDTVDTPRSNSLSGPGTPCCHGLKLQARLFEFAADAVQDVGRCSTGCTRWSAEAPPAISRCTTPAPAPESRPGSSVRDHSCPHLRSDVDQPMRRRKPASE